MNQPINRTVIQVYSSTKGAEEEETERAYAGVQEETDHTPELDVLIIIDNWNA